MTERIVLCVDDEVNILQALKRLLRKEDYILLTASGPEEALEILDTHKVHVVISDQRMPGMSGTELLQKVRERSPDAIRIVFSGYADFNTIMEAVNAGQIYRFLAKPWNDEDLKLTIRQCLEQYALTEHNRLLTEQIREQNKTLTHLNEQLEEMVAERTRSLQLSQELLEKLPLPVIGISAEGIVALINQAARCCPLPLAGINLGDDIRDVFPAGLVAQVENSLNGAQGAWEIIDDRDKCKMQLRIEPLQDHDKARGWILFMQESCGD